LQKPGLGRASGNLEGRRKRMIFKEARKPGKENAEAAEMLI
jgi:hypothetical protein